MATPIYVDAAKANDTGDGLTAATAKKTIQAAYNLVGDGEEVRIKPGTYDLGDGEFDYLYLDDNTAVDFIGYNGGAAVDRDTVIIQGSIGAGATAYAVQFGSEAACSFKDLTIKSATTVNTGVIYWRAVNATYTPDLTLTNVVLINQSSAGQWVIRGADDVDIDVAVARTLTITDSTLTAGDHVTMEIQSCTNVYLKDSIFTSTRNDIAQVSVLYSESLGNIIANGCTFTGLGAQAEATIKILKNATLNLQDCTLSSVAGPYVLKMGTDAYNTAESIGRVVVQGCDIGYSSTGGTYGHGILCGPETVYAKVTNCFLHTPAQDSVLNLGIVFKGCQNGIISDCIVVSEVCIFIKGDADNCTVSNNTCFARGTAGTGSACFKWSNGKDTTPEYPTKGMIWNNIFYAEPGTAARCVTIVDSDTPDLSTSANEMFLDYNCLYGDVLFRDTPNDTNYTTLTTVQGYWDSFEGWSKANELNSLNEDPQLDSNYQSQNPDILLAGRPDINGNAIPMGGTMIKPTESNARARYR